MGLRFLGGLNGQDEVSTVQNNSTVSTGSPLGLYTLYIREDSDNRIKVAYSRQLSAIFVAHR
jgi:hypothetical protein